MEQDLETTNQETKKAKRTKDRAFKKTAEAEPTLGEQQREPLPPPYAVCLKSYAEQESMLNFGQVEALPETPKGGLSAIVQLGCSYRLHFEVNNSYNGLLQKIASVGLLSRPGCNPTTKPTLNCHCSSNPCPVL